MRSVPAAALDLVIGFEQFRAICYKPTPLDVPTIGFGHTKGLSERDLGHLTITMARARDYLAEDMGEAQAKLEAACGADVIARLSEKQYAALVSFVFNAGAGHDWKIWAAVKAGDDAAVPTQLARFIKCGGRVEGGLVRRRAAESALWRQGMDAAPAIGSITAPELAPAAPTQINTAPLPRAPQSASRANLASLLWRCISWCIGFARRHIR